MTTTRFIRLREVLDRTGLTRSHVYALIARGEFPAQVKLGERAAAWVEGDVDAWMASKLGKNVRDAAASAARAA